METLNEAGKIAYYDNEYRLYDEQLKKTLAIKIFLAVILKMCLDEFKDFDKYDIAEKLIEGEPVISSETVNKDEQEILEGMDREDLSKDEGLVRYDILFYAYVPSQKGTVKFIINIEAQQDQRTGYPLLKRAVYYCSRLISAQYNREFKNSRYEKLKKVFSIWICFDASKDNQNTVTRFSLAHDNMIGEAKYKVEDYDLLEIIMICLGDFDDENNRDVIRFINTLTRKNLEPEERLSALKNVYDINITNQIKSEVTTMCNVSYGIAKRNREEERETTLVGAVKNLMKNLDIPVDQALKLIGVPEDEYSKYRKLTAE
ncbi:MAG: Rpn family recombination-promoting nuclease/putative transposase [Clostridiales bacterium]|nr:Rpn family recombination-promoting nuclease/putative transposase [Clostridiales bacterium]